MKNENNKNKSSKPQKKLVSSTNETAVEEEVGIETSTSVSTLSQIVSDHSDRVSSGCSSGDKSSEEARLDTGSEEWGADKAGTSNGAEAS